MPKMSEDHMTLGDLIKALERQPADHAVLYDFGGLAPTGIYSYRGYYDDLAMGFDDDVGYGDCTVTKLLNELKRCVGATFQGYKGGDYVMDEDTPIWVANHGKTGGTGVVGVINKGYYTLIQTDLVD
jgi:DNA-binding beta-propeller fold protein YncE